MIRLIRMNVSHKYLFYIGGKHPHYKCMEANRMRALIYEFIEYFESKDGFQAIEALSKCRQALLEIELLEIDREHRRRLYAELFYNRSN